MIEQGREVGVLVALIVVYVLIATQVESAPEVLAKLFWKTASARPPILLVVTVAGWGVVTDLAKRCRLRCELVIGPAPPLPLWTQLRCAIGLLDAILVCRLFPFVFPGGKVATLSLFSDILAHACCVAFLIWPPSTVCASSSSVDDSSSSKESSLRSRMHGKYEHSLPRETGHARDSLARTLLDALLAPFAPVTFWHVIVADYATSMAKALGDAHVTTCVFVQSFLESEFSSLPPEHSVWWEERRGPCVSSVLNASALALPFWCRLFQCLAVYRKTRENKNLWNAVKYATAFPLIYAGYLLKQEDGGSRTFFVAAAVVQSSATFGWDVLMDWGIFDRKKGGAFCGLFDPQHMRKSLIFSPSSTTTYYSLLILFDLALRFVWTLAVFGNAPTRGAGLFAFEVAEILRRTVWALFRIEWEYFHLELPLAPQEEDQQNDNRPLLDDDDQEAGVAEQKHGETSADIASSRETELPVVAADSEAGGSLK